MMLQDQLITASFILGGSQQAHLQVFQNLLLVCRKLPSFCFCHPRTVKKSGAVVPQKVISSLPARGLSPQKPRPTICWVSFVFIASGFSQMQCLPAFSAASDI